MTLSIELKANVMTRRSSLYVSDTRGLSRDFYDSIHGAERIGDAFRTAPEFVFASRLTAPTPIHHEFEFVVARGKREFDVPIAITVGCLTA
jgi:hypothetical protein